jgi:hypothetical protein
MTYTFKAEVWEYTGEKASWYMVSVPVEQGAEIKFITGQLSPSMRRAFGSVKVKVTIGATTWDSSLFSDSKRGSYILLLNKAVRTAEKISTGDTITIRVALINI